MANRNYTSPARDRHAADTRRTIIEAARTLFAERGYARTSVSAVAAAAGVAVNTVYTSVGGKPALMLAMAEDGAADETVADTLRSIAASSDPGEILRLTAEGTGRVRRRQDKTLSVLLDNRNAYPDLAAAADLATRVVKERLAIVAGRLVETGGLRPGLTRTQVEQTLWFYFGFDAWRTARDLGWTWKGAADWLATQAARTLLAPEEGLLDDPRA